ncbi:hypothetical protein [Spirosoma panaciterrae]|uniref:hypothetical protein n=1 Tax=Spirosoma panaciterrae TaxID=496058 RepID=UPI00037047E8|nr:hypothetical protein [Spirosoma panaciterrae]
MEYEVVITDDFARDVKRLAKKFPSLKDDLLDLQKSLKKEPMQGDALGKGCFKVRLSIKSKGKGKSGGGRVITNVLVIKQKIYLLALYDKSEVSTLTDSRISELLASIEDGEE